MAEQGQQGGLTAKGEGTVCVTTPGPGRGWGLSFRGALCCVGDGSGLERRGEHWVSTPGCCPLVLRPFEHDAWWVMGAEVGVTGIESWEIGKGWAKCGEMEESGALFSLSPSQAPKSGESEEGVSLRGQNDIAPQLTLCC